jgi:hypothetical protein
MREFQEALKDLLRQYEDVVSSFTPLSSDGRVKSFMRHSQFDLLMLLEEQDQPKVYSDWPNVESLFHDFGPYQESAAYINRTVTNTMKGVQKFISVSILLGIEGRHIEETIALIFVPNFFGVHEQR